MLSTKQDRNLFALVDCNNFYASCERVFNPSLVGKAIVVLSNNDGCVIARSNEAKALGIPMGAPYFQFKDFFEQQRVCVYSSNYPLYGQMSQRVMETLEQFSPEIEVYSIDEAFLRIGLGKDLNTLSKQIKKRVYQWTGIPVSVGVAPTKTLAKVANHLAKREGGKEEYFVLEAESTIRDVLSSFDVRDIWGVGSQTSSLLSKNGIRTALELAELEDGWIKKNMSVVGLRTVWELRGISCLHLHEIVAPKKSIVCSKSFGKEVFNQFDLAEALASYVAVASEKLRKQGSLTTFLEVFLNTSRYREEQYYGNSIHVPLPAPSSYTPMLIHYAKHGLSRIFKEGLPYKRVGVMLGGITSNKAIQQDLFSTPRLNEERENAVMKLVDKLNAKYGKNTLTFCAQGLRQDWKMKRARCSNSFTTSWEGLLKIKI